VDSNSKQIAKLKRRYSKWPPNRSLLTNPSSILNYLPVTVAIWILKYSIKSEYTLKRESIKFFALSNRAYGARNLRKCDRLLRIATELLGSNFPKSYESLLRNAIVSTFKNPENRRAISITVFDSTTQVESSFFDATGWYQLSRGLFSLGYFRAAWVARENSLRLSMLEATLKDQSATGLIRGLQAYLEKRNLLQIRELLLLNKHKLSTKSLANIESTLTLIEKKIWPLFSDSGSKHESSREVLRSLVSKKTVAIVGPGVPHGNYGNEIDAFDTVIRMKFIGEKMLDDRNFHGSRTDISYIGAIDALKLQEFELRNDLKNLKLLLSHPTAINVIGSVPVYGFEDDDVIYRTPTTSGIRTLKEVIKMEPSNLKIFGFDFYSTLMPYSKQMTGFYESSSWRFEHPNDFVINGVYLKFYRSRDFSVHDPVSNFCFAQNLYKAGLFDIEPYGKSILELTPYQYVERLEEMLGDW